MPDDERITRLQRLVYGAATPDADRAAAAAELAALQDAVAPEPPTAPASPDSGAPSGPAEGPDGGGRASPTVAVLAAATTLLVGLGVGWAVGAATTADPVRDPASTATPPAAAAVTAGSAADVPFDDAPAMAVFDRTQVESDRTRISDRRIWIDGATQRRLATLMDGAVVTVVRTVNGADVCLVIERPERGGGSTCLQDPAFPAAGMKLDVSLDGIGYAVVWKPSGELELRRTPLR